MLEVKKEIEVTIIDLDYKGDGIAKIDDNFIYVAGALKDEEVEVKLFKLKKNVGFASLIKVLNKSKNRVSATSKLGSMNLSHLSFEEQLNWQEKVTKETFDKVLRKDIKVNNIITDNNELNYRNKATFHVMDNSNITLGLYLSNSKDLVKVDSLDIANKKTNELIKEINASGIAVDYNKLKHIMIKNNSNNELLVTLVSHNRSFMGKEDLVELISKNVNVNGITLNIKDSKEVILGSKSYILYGINELKENKLLMTDQSFAQVNFGVMNLTYDLIKHNIVGKRVIDAYSGIGSISYSLNNDDLKIVMIESNEANIKLANKIAETNKITNVEIVHDLAENAIEKYKADTLIVDPPRVGLKESFVNEVNRQGFDRVIYLSCNLQSLIRDIRLMDEVYSVKEVYPLKMFPQTNSFETLVILEKK